MYCKRLQEGLLKNACLYLYLYLYINYRKQPAVFSPSILCGHLSAPCCAQVLESSCFYCYLHPAIQYPVRNFYCLFSCLVHSNGYYPYFVVCIGAKSKHSILPGGSIMLHSANDRIVPYNQATLQPQQTIRKRHCLYRGRY